MKKIKIAHLYYDLMNLYGENGNVRFLKKKLEEQGIDTEVHFLTVDDDIDFDEYDFYYIGTGSEDNKNIVLEDLIKYKDKVKKAIDDNKYFLVTGNALDLFGDSIINLDNEVKDAIGAFKYQVREEEFRIVGEQHYTCQLFDKKILGFQNRNSVLINYKDEYLFEVLKGSGYGPDDKQEGVLGNNFYGTYLLGPILVRNPYFTEYIIKKICEDLDIKYKTNYKDVSFKAYEEYLKNFLENQ